MVRVAVVGLGKMGLSHLSIINAHPRVTVAGVCDASGYVLDVLGKYTGLAVFSDFDRLLASSEVDAVIIATPSSLHARMVKAALARGIHVFCEKPLCLECEDSREIAALAQRNALVNQVGYHCRFIGAFQEVKRALDVRAIGKVSHALAEAYGPVVLKPQGSTWRTQRTHGGGCLYDYAAHPINLLNWYLGKANAVGGCALNRIFSKDTDDEVLATMYFEEGRTAQLSVNWCDESHRKMSTKVTLWGTNGRIYADRQECQIYIRGDPVPQGYRQGWNVRYTTELTEPVWFYLRGEEYSAQLDYFVRCIEERRANDNLNSFEQAAATDEAIAMILADAERGPSAGVSEMPAQKKRFGFLSRG